ncbi:MAG: sigma factor-like helix-turn-helix DNA-binding protein, partial [Candidatus Paceibacterota bacterium]
LKTLAELDSLAQSSYHRQSLLAQNDRPQQDEQMTKLLSLLADGVLIHQLQRTSSSTERFLKDYSEKVVAAETSDKITTLLDVLNEREYKVIYDYYFLDKTFMEISEELNNISKSWMSRLHHQALRKMRDAYLRK